MISRAAAMFDHVTVTVMVNIHKTGVIPVEKRLKLLCKACAPYQNVSVDCWEGLLAEYMSEKNERIVIRGIRSGIEFEQEMQSSVVNRTLNRQIETVFIPADPAHAGISSTAVRELALFGGDIKPFVPEQIIKEIRILLSKNNDKE